VPGPGGMPGRKGGQKNKAVIVNPCGERGTNPKQKSPGEKTRKREIMSQGGKQGVTYQGFRLRGGGWGRCNKGGIGGVKGGE